MARPKGEKKEKRPKYETSPEIEKVLADVLKNCSTVFSYLKTSDFQVLLKDGKNKLGKKHVVIKIIKEPISFLTTKKLIVLVTNEWWDENVDSDRIKAIVEALTGIMTDDDGNYVKRDFDVETYSDLLKNPEFDYSKFSAVLPAEAKVEPLVLTEK